MIESFHFLRPMFLLLIPVVAALWWWTRRIERDTRMTTNLAPHLAEALTVGQRNQRLIKPVDTLSAILLLGVLALSGPSWRQLPAPWFSEEAPVVVALEVSDSMRSNDVLPTRLDRARIKVLELIKQRTGARTALIAYADSAHLVVPLTTDLEVIRLFLESLDPLMMPMIGSASGNSLDEALNLSRSLFSGAEQSGTLVIITDSLEATDSTTLAQHEEIERAPSVIVYVAGTEAGGVALLPDGTMARDRNGGSIDTRVQLDRIQSITRPLSIPVIQLSPDTDDIRQLIRTIKSQATAAEDPDSLWIDEAWWLLWPILFLMLIHFRQGWTAS